MVLHNGSDCGCNQGHFFVTTQTKRSTVDPNATWQMLCEYLQALHQDPDDSEIRANVLELLGALSRWLRSGGFPPTISSGGFDSAREEE